jgi:ribosomal protein S8
MKTSNYFLATFIAKLNMGSLRRVRFITINYSKLTITITKLLYLEGIIRIYKIINNKIYIYFKYIRGLTLFKFKLISKPSKRIYWSLHKLSLNYSKESFSGFYIISTPIGLITSYDCLLYRHLSGEILFKIYI